MHTHHATHDSPRPPVMPLARTRVQNVPPAQFANRSEWLRARKAALRFGFGYRAPGGQKLIVIAMALGVDEAKASRMLSDSSDVHVTETHLSRLDGTEFAYVADAVRSVRLDAMHVAVAA